MCLSLMASAAEHKVLIEAVSTTNTDMVVDGDRGKTTSNKNAMQPLRSIKYKNVTLTFGKNEGNDPAWWNYYDGTPDIRVYQTNTLTVKAPEGSSLKSVSFKLGDKALFKTDITASPADGSFAPDVSQWGPKNTFEWTAGATNSNEVTFTLAAQLRFTEVTVTYETADVVTFGDIVATIDGNAIEAVPVDEVNSLAEAAVPTNSNLSVSCEGATSVAVKMGGGNFNALRNNRW